MTYAMGGSLQMAVYTRLRRDAAIDAAVGAAVYDAVPDAAPDLFVALGPEKVTGVSDSGGEGAVHQIRVSVVTRRGGYIAAKTVAALVCDSLVGSEITLSRGRLVSMRFLRAEARRDEGEGTRRIDLLFRARLDDRAE